MAKQLSQAEKIHQRLSQDLPINSKVAKAIVKDPYAQNGESIQVLRSVRDDPLAGMHARQQIDDAQFVAGRRWQAHFEGAEVGLIRAIDPAKEFVDGGNFPDPLPDRKVEAMAALREADKALGWEGRAIVRTVLGDRLTVNEAAHARGARSEAEIKYVGRRFRECLETLAVLWGFAGRT